ncbi:serine hydrolase domain-containing protein [Thermoproteota archaeon]
MPATGRLPDDKIKDPKKTEDETQPNSPIQASSSAGKQQFPVGEQASDTAADQQSFVNKTQAIQAHLQQFSDQNLYSGIVLIQKGPNKKIMPFGKTITNTPISENTMMRIGSVTKLFTDTAIKELIHMTKHTAQEITFQTTIDKILPNSLIPDDRRASKITISQLLTHTSGIAKEINSWDTLMHSKTDTSLTDLVKLAMETPLDFEPGTIDERGNPKFSYSNLGYSILAYVIGHTYKQITNQTDISIDDAYKAFISNAVFKKLEMENTGFIDDFTFAEQENSRGLRFNESGETNPVARNNLSPVKGSGNMFSSALDLLNFMRSDMARNQLPKGPKLYHLEGFGHAGAISGACTMVFTYKNPELQDYNKDEDTTIICLSNRGDPHADLLHRDVTAIAMDIDSQKVVPIDPNVKDFSTALYEKFTGAYAFTVANHPMQNIITTKDSILFIEYRQTFDDKTPQKRPNLRLAPVSLTENDQEFDYKFLDPGLNEIHMIVDKTTGNVSLDRFLIGFKERWEKMG